MIDFAGAFLIRTTRITIKDACTAHRYCIPVLNLLWIGKLTSVIRKYNRKQTVEILCPKNTVKRLKDVDDRTSRIGFPQKSEHKTGLYKMNRKQAFPSGFSDDAIHLYDGCLRFFFKKFLEIRITASQTAPPVYFKFWLFISGTILYLAWQIDIPDLKKLSVHIII